jgi:hypothetical protein
MGTRGHSLFGVILAALFAAAGMATSAHAGTLRRGSTPTTASGAVDPGTFFTAYYDVSEDTGAGDNVLRLSLPTRSDGNLCAMIYVFDDDEELGECCGCPLTPNQLATLSVENDLTSNWEIAGFDTDSGVIQIMSFKPNNLTSCDPAKGCNGGCDPTTGGSPDITLNGSITHTQLIGRIVDLTEVDITDNGNSDSSECPYLEDQCASIISNGSGRGVCDCGTDNLVGPPG